MAVLVNAIILFVNFTFFYFGNQYFSGKGLQTFSTCAIWRRLFYALSAPGYWIASAYEFIFHLFMGNFWRRLNPVVNMAFNVLGYAVLTYCLQYFSAALLHYIFPFMEELVEFEVVGASERTAVVGNLATFTDVLYAIHTANSHGFVLDLLLTIGYFVSFALYYILHFSMAYGLLEGVMVELDALAFEIDRPSDWNPAPLSLGELVGNIQDSIADFFTNLSIIKWMKYPGVIVIVMICCLVGGFYQNTVGVSHVASDLLKELIDAIGIMDIIKAFVFVALLNFVLQLLVQLLVRIMPQSVQDGYVGLCERAYASYLQAKAKRLETFMKWDWTAGDIGRIDLGD